MAAKPINLKFNKRHIAGFTGNQLKMIAFILMLCDHVGYMLIENGVLYAQNPMYWNMALETAAGQRWYLAARILRFLGRLSFPIFAFLTVEGFLHTGNVKKYMLRLLIFALISEVPFDLAIKGVPRFDAYQNVLFTLLLGVCALYMMERPKKPRLLWKILVGAVFCGIAYYVKCDYGAVGVGLICVLYLLREDKNIQLAAGAVISAAESYSYCGVAALSYFLIWFYNGRRGDLSMKYFFYIAYPAHLLLFYLMVFIANR